MLVSIMRAAEPTGFHGMKGEDFVEAATVEGASVGIPSHVAYAIPKGTLAYTLVNRSGHRIMAIFPRRITTRHPPYIQVMPTIAPTPPDITRRSRIAHLGGSPWLHQPHRRSKAAFASGRLRVITTKNGLRLAVDPSMRLALPPTGVLRCRPAGLRSGQCDGLAHP